MTKHIPNKAERAKKEFSALYRMFKTPEFVEGFAKIRSRGGDLKTIIDEWVDKHDRNGKGINNSGVPGAATTTIRGRARDTIDREAGVRWSKKS